MTYIVRFKELRDTVGGRSAAEVAARLALAGIRYHIGKNRLPWTTIDAINASLGIENKKDKTTGNPTVIVK